MIQKEVAERIDAEPSSKEYSALSLLVQYYCDTKIIRKAPPQCFMPRPKVDSIVIKLDKLDKPRVSVDNEKLFFDIIRSSFNMRRKTLWNAAKTLKVEKDPKRRGETLTIEEFALLSDKINKYL